MSSSRRKFLTTGASATLATIASITSTASAGPASTSQLDGLRTATPADLQNLVGDARKRRILLRGGIVLGLDPEVGDFGKAAGLIAG